MCVHERTKAYVMRLDISQSRYECVFVNALMWCCYYWVRVHIRLCWNFIRFGILLFHFLHNSFCSFKGFRLSCLCAPLSLALSRRSSAHLHFVRRQLVTSVSYVLMPFIIFCVSVRSFLLCTLAQTKSTASATATKRRRGNWKSSFVFHLF